MYNESAKECTLRYKKKHLETVRFDVPKGTLQAYKEFASSNGESLAQMMRRLVAEEMEKRNYK
ncbi:MAG: hypothetical protein MJ071_08220 [Oscillospiraceae bacterium]|nr:hypothetical protein [Oscillospiraceae bacterium]